MRYVIPDRKAVAQLNYQLRRFERQCDELPAETFALLHGAMCPLRQLLAALSEDDALENA